MHDDCKVLWMMHIHETFYVLFKMNAQKWCWDKNHGCEIKVINDAHVFKR